MTNGGWQTQYRHDLFGLETGRTFAGDRIRSRTDRDSLGRVTGQKIEKNNRYLSEKPYLWGTNDKLLSVATNGKIRDFGYDNRGNLSKTIFEDVRTEPVATWVFEEGTFVPAAKITEQQQYSIVTNYLGTPEAMYREDGEEVWACELNSYGKVRLQKVTVD